MQVSDTVTAMKTQGEFTLIKTVEIIEAEWPVRGRSVRPSHRMVGYTRDSLLQRGNVSDVMNLNNEMNQTPGLSICEPYVYL